MAAGLTAVAGPARTNNFTNVAARYSQRPVLMIIREQMPMAPKWKL